MNNPETAETDPAGTGIDLVSELESWRETLAKEIAKRNHGFHGGGPDLAVQRIISGILLLRIFEEKGIMPYGSLGHILQGEGRFSRFCVLLRRAEARYGSGLFALSIPGNTGDLPGGAMLSDLSIGDDIFGRIVTRTYSPDVRLDFQGITSVRIAGVFERLLERTIRISGHRLAIEERDEPGTVRSLPITQDVVDDMVEQTVGRSAGFLSPREMSSYRILDPACGSGGVLLSAYRFLLAWHRDWYIRNLVPLLGTGMSIGSPEFQAILPGNGQDQKGTRRGSRFDLPVRRVGESNGSDPSPVWTLTLAEKKRILTGILHGVDTDRRAVEATKCALLIELLADEDEASVLTELSLSGNPLLPLLDRNIRCGNPLIGMDYSDSGQSPPYDFRERKRINPFDWGSEFPGVFERGGFDLVIGNLPRGSKEYGKERNTYLQTHYRVFH
ncbi:MAG: SAM-dependent methyltransferase, partial [Methanoregulaceae archaeon]|nr:SAM-dependent methyltransferase [Methanoregulaceae archaeon]